MQSKTELGKQYLMAALKLLDTNALADARFNIGKAIREVEKVENERSKRSANSNLDAPAKSLADQWRDRLKASVSNSLSPAESLNQLDKMIEVEKNKLNKPEEPKNLDTLLG